MKIFLKKLIKIVIGLIVEIQYLVYEKILNFIFIPKNYVMNSYDKKRT
jgi:hypothetical protein